MENETKNVSEEVKHPHSTKEYIKWLAEVYKMNEARNLLIADEIGDIKKSDWELLLTPFPVGGRNGPRPGY